MDEYVYDQDPCPIQATRPKCLRILGLPVNCTESQVRTAFRKKSKRLHPDAGGSKHDFVRLRTAYDEALEYARHIDHSAAKQTKHTDPRDAQQVWQATTNSGQCEIPAAPTWHEKHPRRRVLWGICIACVLLIGLVLAIDLYLRPPAPVVQSPSNQPSGPKLPVIRLNKDSSASDPPPSVPPLPRRQKAAYPGQTPLDNIEIEP